MPTLTDKQRAALATLMSDDAIVGRLTLDDVVGALYALTGDACGAHIHRRSSWSEVTVDTPTLARVLRTVMHTDDSANFRAAEDELPAALDELAEWRSGKRTGAPNDAAAENRRAAPCIDLDIARALGFTESAYGIRQSEIPEADVRGRVSAAHLPLEPAREDRTEEEIDFAMTGDYGGNPIATDERDPVEAKIERDAAAEHHRAEALAAKGAPGVVADPVRPAAPVSDPVMEHMRSCGARRGLPCDCADWKHPER